MNLIEQMAENAKKAITSTKIEISNIKIKVEVVK